MKTKKNINPVRNREHDSRSTSNGVKYQIDQSGKIEDTAINMKKHLFNKSNINKKKHYKSQTKGNLSSNIYVSKYFTNIIFTHMFFLNTNAITKETIAKNKFIVNIDRFIFFGCFRKGDNISPIANHPAERLIKRSAITEYQILLINIIKNVSRFAYVVNGLYKKKIGMLRVVAPGQLRTGFLTHPNLFLRSSIQEQLKKSTQFEVASTVRALLLTGSTG